MDNLEKQWIRVDIFTATGGLEPLGASLLELGINGFQVFDRNTLEEFLDRNAGYWDYYDESLLKLRDAETTVTLYLPDNEQGFENLGALKQELKRLKSLDAENEWGRLECALSGIREEDWANGWKKYYHPTKPGEKIVICPSWEEYKPACGETVVRLDPGMAFGTGTHESTRLCIKLMEKYIEDKNLRILDFGCGSGILAISAVLLGGAAALGVDIDEGSVKVANENAALNGASKECKFIKDAIGNHIDGVYDIIFANLVADIIIEHANDMLQNLSDSGILIASGIIDIRENDVTKALLDAGLRVIERAEEGGWVAFALKR